MPVHHITNPGDPRLDPFRDIPDPELVKRRGVFVAEGRLLVRRLLSSARFRTRAVLATEAALGQVEDLVAPRIGELDVYVVSRDDLVAASGFTFHRGCLALGERPAQAASLGDLALDAPGPHLVLALEAIGNADNVGALFRNAAAFGVRAVVLDARSCDPLYRKATRTSMGATLDVPFATMTDWVGTLTALRAAGYAIVALTPSRDAVDIEQASVTSRGTRLVLLAGSEDAGLQQETLALADRRVSIAMAPGIDSLNVATAAGIALHRLSSLRQHD